MFFNICFTVAGLCIPGILFTAYMDRRHVARYAKGKRLDVFTNDNRHD